MRLFRPLQKALDVLHADRKEIGDNIESAAAQQHTHKCDEQAETKPPLAVRIEPQADSDEEKARKSGTDGRDTVRLSVEQATLRVAVLALAISSVVAVANILQWVQTRRATEVALISANASQEGAEASKAQARAAASQAEATRQSIQTTVSSFQLDQRAWVGFNYSKITPLSKESPVTAEVGIINAGKTNAVDAKIALHIAARNELLKILPHNTFQEPEKSTATLFPQQQIASLVILKDLKGKVQYPTDTDISDFNAGKLFVYVWAEINYRDVFGVQHVTEFCNYFTGGRDPRGTACEMHNSAN